MTTDEIAELPDPKVATLVMKTFRLPGQTLTDLMDEWKRLTDDDKADLVQSARRNPDQLAA